MIADLEAFKSKADLPGLRFGRADALVANCRRVATFKAFTEREAVRMELAMTLRACIEDQGEKVENLFMALDQRGMGLVSKEDVKAFLNRNGCGHVGAGVDRLWISPEFWELMQCGHGDAVESMMGTGTAPVTDQSIQDAESMMASMADAQLQRESGGGQAMLMDAAAQAAAAAQAGVEDAKEATAESAKEESKDEGKAEEAKEEGKTEEAK